MRKWQKAKQLQTAGICHSCGRHVSVHTGRLLCFERKKVLGPFCKTCWNIEYIKEIVAINNLLV